MGYEIILKEKDRRGIKFNQDSPQSIEKTTENPSQFCRHLGSNQVAPECESRVLPRSHLAWPAKSDVLPPAVEKSTFKICMSRLDHDAWTRQKANLLTICVLCL